MAGLNLKTVNFNLQRSFPNYIISSIIDSDWGRWGVQLINTPEELDRYYEGYNDREGLVALLDGGSSLLLNRLERYDTRSPSLRLFNSDFKYSHPEDYESVEFEHSYGDQVELQPTFQNSFDELLKDINLHETLTYSIVLDFSDNLSKDEDYIVIPSYNNTDPTKDTGIIFYWTDLNPANILDLKQPNEFASSVNLGTLGFQSLGIDINLTDSSDRAKIIYEWYLGILDDSLNSYNLVGNQIDPNVIPERCILDESSNKLTLVFKKPIRNVKYYNSLGGNPFEVYSDRFLNQELISESNSENSVVSFSTEFLGDINMTIDFHYVKKFEYDITVTFGDITNTHYVSLDSNADLYQGESIFIEDVLDINSDLLKCNVHLGTKINAGEFTEEDAAFLEGTYLISYGKRGSSIPINGELTPFQSSVDSLTESDILSNIFLFNDDISIESQEYCLENYLTPNLTVGMVNLPTDLLSEEAITSKLLEDSKREIMIYSYGESIIQDRSSTIRSNYLYALNSVTGNFKGEIPDQIFPDLISDEIKDILEKKYINYILNNQDYHYINYIYNLDSFIEPHYLMVANYVKTYVTRYLKNKLGLYEEDLHSKLEKEISKISSYSTLLESIDIGTYIAVSNNLTVVLNVNLEGLVGRSLDVKINIHK